MKSEQTTVINNMEMFVRYLRENVDRELPIQQLHILFEIAKNEGIDSLELKKRTNIPGGSLSRNIQRLECSHELVEVRRDTRNRKRFCYHLTEKGREMLDSLGCMLEGHSRNPKLSIKHLLNRLNHWFWRFPIGLRPARS